MIIQRKTKQRAAIIQAVMMAERPLTPQEIHVQAKAEFSALGIATVYRAIHMLVEEGLIIPVALPGQALRYEKAGLKHHHHFVCRHCEKVYEMAGCAYQHDYTVPANFQVEAHEVILYGRCAHCVEN